MKVIFKNSELEYLYKYGKEKGKPKYSFEVIKGFIKKVNLLLDVENSVELRMFKGARYEKLSGDLKGFESIRINDQFRILLRIRTDHQKEIKNEVSYIYDILDYH